MTEIVYQSGKVPSSLICVQFDNNTISVVNSTVLIAAVGV